MKRNLKNKEKDIVLKDPMDVAADYLGRRTYSSHDLAKKLVEKGYEKTVVDETISKMLEYGYLNDEEYAARASRLLEESGKGNQYIKEKLKQSGISSNLLPELGDEFERAIEVAKKMDGKTPEQIGRRLASRGFTPATVYKVMSKIR